MSDERSGSTRDRAGAPRGEGRQQPLRRAGIAVAAAVVLIVVALVIEQGSGDPAATPKLPVTRAVSPIADPALAVGGSGADDAASTAPAPAATSGSMPGVAPAAEAEEAPVAQAESAASQGNDRDESSPAATGGAVDSPPSPLARTAPPQPDPAALAGYRIQLGVFDVPANAEALQRELTARGLPAHLQSRVVLGPYPTRAKAQAAQAALRKAGQAPGIVVPPRDR